MPAISGSKYLVMAGWDHCPHLDERTKAELLASTPEHLRKARSQGIPSMGSGAVFPVDEESLKERAFSIPPHWPRICGWDFGWDHPSAGAWMAWDRDIDVVHVYDAYRVSQASVALHAAAIRAKGLWIPVAWPHDGLQHDKGSGVQLAEQYRQQGVSMLKDRATFPDGSNGVEAGIMDMLDRMQTGRLMVAAHLHDWWEEFRLYHRENGVLVKKGDDLMSATRYGIMMLRKAAINSRVAAIKSPVGYTPFDSGMGALG